MPILRRLLPALLCVAVLSTSAAAQDMLAHFKAAGTVRVGFLNQVPYGYADEGGVLTGTDVEIARLVFSAWASRPWMAC